jgi:AMMECR1 domain-containing protein
MLSAFSCTDKADAQSPSGDVEIRLLASLADSAVSSVKNQFDTGAAKGFAEIAYSDNERGIAVRFLSGDIDRGCLAFYRGVDDFAKAARTAALDAAFFDNRYPAIERDEFDSLDVEISLFGEFRATSDPKDFSLGADSIHITLGEKHALMQASLPGQRGWDKIAFLQALCGKAGLAPDAWRNPQAIIKKAPTVWRRFHVRDFICSP